MFFIHALSKEATQEQLNEDINHLKLTKLTPGDYIVITDPKITTNEVKHRIEKAIRQDKTIFITSPAIQKIKARKHIYDLFKDKINYVRTRIHYEPPLNMDEGTPEVPVVNITLEHEDGTETDILALDQFDAHTPNMLANHLSLYVWGNPTDEDYTHKLQFPLSHNKQRDEL